MGIFGKVIACLHVIEFQRWGLPHANMLDILASEFKVWTSEDMNVAVCAKLPKNDEL